MVLLRRFLYEITQPFPSKLRRLAAMRGKGGRETWSVCRFVFFLQRRGGHPFLIGLCPKGSLIIKNEKLKNKKVRGHAAEDQNQIRASRVSRTIVRNQSQKWPEIEYMPTSNCSLHKNEDFQPQSFKVATILKQQRGEKWWSGWDWFSHSYAVNNLKLTYIPFLALVSHGNTDDLTK